MSDSAAAADANANPAAPPPSSSAEVAAKLPHEREHLDALQRMRTLDAYYRWTFGQLRRYMGRRVLDAGAGIGNFTALAEPCAEYVMAAELSPANLDVLRERFTDSKVVEVAQFDLDGDLAPLAARRFDTIVCLDVLEHIEDDVAAMRRLRQLVQPGGHLLVKVPACRWLYGSVDVASDHYRRYGPRELRDKAAAAGWEPLRAWYMNLAGVLPYFLKSRVLRRQANFSRTFKPWQLRVMAASMPVLRAVDRVTGPFVGQSALLVARNPAPTAGTAS